MTAILKSMQAPEARRESGLGGNAAHVCALGPKPTVTRLNGSRESGGEEAGIKSATVRITGQKMHMAG